MAQTIPGISKIIYKATSGSFSNDVEYDGNQIGTDSEVLLETIATATAKGGVRHQGNRSFDFTLNIFDTDVITDLATHKNEWGDLEFYQIDNDTTPVLTLENVNPLVNERVAFDPSDEASAYVPVVHQGVNVA
jgi:hypothetical protein